jgi:hypothetical protein
MNANLIFKVLICFYFWSCECLICLFLGKKKFIHLIYALFYHLCGIHVL